MSRYLAVLCALWLGGAAWGQGLTGLARVVPEATRLTDTETGAELVLGLSQPVPYRVYTLDAPRRLVLDFSVVDFSLLDVPEFAGAEAVAGLETGPAGPGWSRLSVDLSAPLAVRAAWMETGPGATVTVRLERVSEDAFAAAAGAPLGAEFDLPVGAAPDGAHRRQDGTRAVVVMLDPGHGGVDPGAERGGAVEAELMLLFARELREVLHRTGRFEVHMTRDADLFVPLERRVSLARAAGADVFLSLHADALAEGRASGATIYTLGEAASAIATEKLAERHDRGDLLAGLDLTHHDDGVARVLMDLARTETRPRADRLADALVAGLSETIDGLHKRPRMEASFSVLKAADIPSVLIELGFLSSARDRENLHDPAWRARAAAGIRDGLLAWAAADAAEAALLRK